MADLPVTEYPKFSETMEQITNKDRAAPDTFNPRYQVLLDNDNYLKQQLETRTREAEITLLAANWSAAAPYTQTVDVPGLKETDKVQIMSAVTKDTPAETSKSWGKMAGMIKAGEALNGQAVFYCLEKKPTSDFNIKLLGVSENE